jgi:hypothetical protein
MSHFSSIEMEFRNEASIVEALKSYGWEVEVHATPQPLHGWPGISQAQQCAEIVVRKGVLRTQSDLGFARNPETGNYTAIVDSYDIGSKFIAEFAERYLTTEIGHAKGLSIASSETLNDGTIRMVVRQRKPQQLQLGVGGASTKTKSSFGF